MKIEFENIDQAVINEVIAARHAREVLAAEQAIRNQVALNALAAQDHRSVDGLGAPLFYLDPIVAGAWMRSEGAGVLTDPTWQRYMRDAGLQFIKAKGTRVQVGWTGNGKRETLKY